MSTVKERLNREIENGILPLVGTCAKGMYLDRLLKTAQGKRKSELQQLRFDVDVGRAEQRQIMLLYALGRIAGRDVLTEVYKCL